MISNASSSEFPCPKNAGAEPMPPKLPQPSETRGARLIRQSVVSSLRSSQSSGKKRLWISLPSTSTGVPCVPTTEPPMIRSTTTKWRARQTTTRSSHSIRSSASW